jgi:hypothetical protein
LVLAAATFWDLVKIVTAFTVAHSLTLTLTLAALNLVHLPGRVVEPFVGVRPARHSVRNEGAVLTFVMQTFAEVDG